MAKCSTIGTSKLTTHLGPLGNGVTLAGDISLTPGHPDRPGSDDGSFLYLRDRNLERLWSATYFPTRITPDAYEFHTSPERWSIERLNFGIRTNWTVTLSVDLPVERRDCWIRNESDSVRELEITYALLPVLQRWNVHAAHPAFSRLFLETERLPHAPGILIRRRPREFHEHTWKAALFVPEGPQDSSWGPLSWETDRAQFQGRGRSLRCPLAIERGGELSGTVGPVLDPVMAVRRLVTLLPGQSTTLTFGLAADTDEATVRHCAVRGMSDQDHPDDLFPSSIRGESDRNGFAAPPQGDPWGWIFDRDKVDGSRPSQSPRSTNSNGSAPPSFATEPLGTFAPDGRSYVICIRPDECGGWRLPPMPWTHIVANHAAGFMVSERGSLNTWVGNSRENRLTPWHNDPLADSCGEALYVRDCSTGNFWSPLPSPAPALVPYRVEYGFGWARFDHSADGLQQSVTLFVPPTDPLRIVLWELRNDSDRLRELDVASYQEWVLGSQSAEGIVETQYRPDLATAFARRVSRTDYAGHVAFATLHPEGSNAQVECTSDRGEFLGPGDALATPSAMLGDTKWLSAAVRDIEPCAAFRARIVLAPGETQCVIQLLGEAPHENLAEQLIRRYSDVGQVRRALDESIANCRTLLDRMQVTTPCEGFNQLANGWLPYQTSICRLKARSSYYQGGGAIGFRDQLQDSLAFLVHDPRVARDQILLHAAHQFPEGDVLHWWHPPASRGLRTRFSDDLLWLPYAALEYVASTGDDAIWREPIPFVVAPPLEPDQQEAFGPTTVSTESATLLEHCCRALDRSLQVGSHGLPLMGCGDWNDGMSRVGAAGRGESVWLACFLFDILRRFEPLAWQSQDQLRAARYADHAKSLAAAVDRHGWDGAWYRRAYLDDGRPLGSQHSRECQIDGLVQAWAVLSEIAPPERAAAAVRAAIDTLGCPASGVLRLLTPPFDSHEYDVGYIRGYLPGIRENGGQYTHGVLWLIRALAQLGQGTEAVDWLERLTPMWHHSTNARRDTYQTEPYVVAADVYGTPPHLGRGGWTWYTGSAGWMLRILQESILGIRIMHGRTLQLSPAISSAWPAYRVRFRDPHHGSIWNIQVENPERRESGVREVTCDGQPVTVDRGIARLDLLLPGGTHVVRARM